MLQRLLSNILVWLLALTPLAAQEFFPAAGFTLPGRIPAAAACSIALRGTPTTGSQIDGSDLTFSLPTGLQENDVVYVSVSYGTAGGTETAAATGWTLVGATVRPAGSQKPNQGVLRKVMGASPDSSITVTGPAGTQNTTAGIAIAFSCVDTTTPEDGVTPTSATGAAGAPDPPSITPATTGAWALICGAIDIIDVTGTGAPSGYANFTQVSANDNQDTSNYVATKSGLTASVAENPGTFTGTTAANWTAFSLVLRPKP